MLTGFFQKLFDDPELSDGEPQALARNVVSDLLPYRFYDAQNGDLYFNVNSTGFLIEVQPVIGSADPAATLHNVLNQAPNDSTIQFINWTSPNIDRQLLDWSACRFAGDDLVRRMAEKRIDHLYAKRYGDTHSIKAIPHHRRLFVAGWLDGEASMMQRKELQNLRRALYAVFGGEQNTRLIRPAEFLHLMGEIMHIGSVTRLSELAYNDQEPLNYQLPGVGIRVNRCSLGLMGEPAMSVASASVRRYPREFNFQLGSALNGIPEKVADRAHGPVLTTFTMRVRSKASATGDLMKKRAGLQHTASTQFARFSPHLAEKIQEYESINDQIEAGEKLLDTTLIVNAYALGGPDDARVALAQIQNIYRQVGLVTENDTFVQLPMFLSSLPFNVCGARMLDLKKLQRMKILKAAAASALAPLHGEWTGSGTGRGVLLLGRQGQISEWDNFASSGNYNVSVVGKSGAGKSVFMQELITSIYASGGKVVVIDDGYSFKTTVEILGGNFVVFDGSRDIRLNPFSMVSVHDMAKPEYRADAIELITRIIASMAALGASTHSRVEELEEGHISRVVGQIWDEKGPEAEVTDVWYALNEIARIDPRMSDVVVKLEAFTTKGAYGRYFKGPANLQLDGDFTVFELSDIKAQKVLQDVVLQLIMFLGTELMYKTDRSVPVAILIDEAWDLLHSHATAKFIEGVVRRARKYTGALITGTQSIDDYYHNVAATVCFQNSDWTVCLAQKPETIDRLQSDTRLAVNGHVAAQLKTLRSERGAFSEMGIKGPDGWVFSRLMLDQFSLAVYSSKGSTVEKIRRLKEQGYTTVEAIEQLVQEGGVE